MNHWKRYELTNGNFKNAAIILPLKTSGSGLSGKYRAPRDVYSVA